MIEKLTKLLMQWCVDHGRVLKITGTAGPDDVYLIRYYLVNTRFFNFFIHQFLRSDRDDLHDHPWDFVTYLVKGAYTELKYNPLTDRIDQTRRMNLPRYDHYYERKLNRFVFRKATDQHRVVVDRDLKPHEVDQSALTICITGPTRREWGFVRELPEGRIWTPWYTYLNKPKDASRKGL